MKNLVDLCQFYKYAALENQLKLSIKKLKKKLKKCKLIDRPAILKELERQKKILSELSKYLNDFIKEAKTAEN